MKSDPAIIVLFGITGDLSKRKLLPSLYKLHDKGLLHDDTVILGSSRRQVSAQDIVGQLDIDGDTGSFADRIHMIQYDPSEDSDGTTLKDKLESIANGKDMLRLFYLSIPPETLTQVVQNLGSAGLNDEKTRLLIEKPYGHDLESAEQLTDALAGVFPEDQIYRIDHFSSKDTVQGIAAFRQQNGLFDGLLNKDYVASVYVRGHETLDIQGRGDFYEQTGAMRDLIQSHLLQILAEACMPVGNGKLTAEAIHSAKKDFLESLNVPADMATNTVRGQYDGYRDEIESQDSTTETFAAIELTSNDPRWEGVSFILETGKALPQKVTDVTVTFKATDKTEKAAQLVFDIEPLHQISMTTRVKQPGFADDHYTDKAMVFNYDETFDEVAPEAYERVFHDCLRGNQALFVTAAEALACWRIIQPISDAWATAGQDGLQSYAKGSDGPSLASLS